MVTKDKLKKKIIVLNGAPVNLDKFYPAIKDAFESQGFGLMETGTSLMQTGKRTGFMASFASISPMRSLPTTQDCISRVQSAILKLTW